MWRLARRRRRCSCSAARGGHVCLAKRGPDVRPAKLEGRAWRSATPAQSRHARSTRQLAWRLARGDREGDRRAQRPGSRDRARLATALRLWTTACDSAGDPLACSNLAGFYYDGEGAPHDEQRSAQLFAKACDRDDNFSCGMLALAYSEGRGVERDQRRAFALADKGCRLKSPSACTVLGLGWVEGWNGRWDLVRAVELFRSSCEHDDVSGRIQLGYALRSGRGVARDPVRARQYIETACRRAPQLEACKSELGTAPTRER